MRVLLTGATGFLGSHIVDALLAGGHEVVALVRPRRLATPDVQLPTRNRVPGDILDPESLGRAFAHVDAVIHTAAMVTFAPGAAGEQRRVNVEGTRNVVEAARAAAVRRLVYTSSVAAVGRAPGGGAADEETRYDWPPGLGYNESKRDAERLVRRATGLETVCLNPALIFGPGEVSRRTLGLFRLVKRGLLPLVPPGATTICDVRDVAAAHVAALTAGEPGARYILGGPHLSFRALATTIAEVTGGRRPLATVPASLLRAASLPLAALGRLGLPLPIGPGNLAYLMYEGTYRSQRAEATLGYRSRPAVETLGDAARWYAAEGLL